MGDLSGGIARFAALIPKDLLNESGKVFYSGRDAFSSPARLYVLGVNPGGDPANYATETVGEHTRRVLEDWPADWSAYRDEVWEGAAPGTHGMAPRVLHLFRRLGLDPGAVPASNLFFVRSTSVAGIRARQAALADLCWPFHERVLSELKPRAVICFGGDAGNYVRRKLGATRMVGEFVEQNDRRWRSRDFESSRGVRVVVVTHPSRADWRTPSTDPSELVREAMT